MNSRYNEPRGEIEESSFYQEFVIKKREYMQRVLEVEHATFTPLVLGTNGRMGRECSRFVSEQANNLAIKQDESYATTTPWIRTKLPY